MKHDWVKDEDGKIDTWAWESGFHNGPVCRACGKRPCISCDPDWEEMDDCPGDTRKPMTKADRIRAMSDEELADALARECIERESCYGCFAYVKDLKCPAENAEAWKEWLQQTAEEG